MWTRFSKPLFYRGLCLLLVLGLVFPLAPSVAATTAAAAPETSVFGVEPAPADEAVRAPQAVVPADLIVQDGDTPPGSGGNPVTSLNSPFTNGSGQVGFTGSVGDNFVWFDTGIVWRNSDWVTNTLAGAESTMGIGDNGEFIYSPSVDGEDAVWTHNGLLAVGGTQAPGFAPGVISTFHSRPTMLPGGGAYWVAGFNDSGGITTLGRVLYYSPNAMSGTISVVLRSDDIVGGFTIARPDGINFDYQLSDDGSHHIQRLLMETGSTTNDGFVYVDGALVAREADPTGAGDNWDNFDIVSINDDGDYIFTGDTDGTTTSDEFIAYNGSIVLREGDSLGGITLTSSASLQAASLNNLGQAVHAWGISGGSEHLFFACEAANLIASSLVLSTDDEVDFDGDGFGDALVTDFNASTVVGPGLWLAEDGYVYIEVDLNYGGADLEAIIRLALPSCEPNQAPVAVDDYYETPSDTPLNVPAPGVLGNDMDPDNDPLTATLQTDVPTGTLALNADGSFDYTPLPGWTGLVTFTYYASDGLLNSNVATVYITVSAGPDIVVYAPPLETALCPDSTDLITFTVCNAGTGLLVWTITEITGALPLLAPTPETAIVPAIGPNPFGDAGRIEGALPVQAPIPDGPVQLVLDDGTSENALGLGVGGQFIWLNRFTPDPALFPFTLQEVQHYFYSGQGVVVGDVFDIYIYEDTDGDGDPGTGAAFLGDIQDVTAQALDAWSVWPLGTPVLLNGPGDVLIAAVNRTAVAPGIFPATMDQTASQGRSWVGVYSAGSPGDPPTLPADSLWTIVDGLGYPGNWMFRGYGGTSGSGDIPWLSEDPTGGTVNPGMCREVDVTFDSAGMLPGEYYAGLLIESNDPDTPSITLPVTMTVLEPAAIIAVDTISDGCGVTFTAFLAGEPPLSWEWDFGAFGTFTGVNPIFVDFGTDGSYPYTLTAWNDCSMEMLTGTVKVACLPCNPPTNLGLSWSPLQPGVDVNVTFTGYAEGSAPILFGWNFGDGGTGSGMTVTHAYTLAGDYVVLLVAGNTCGVQVITDTITVYTETICVPVTINDVAADITGCVVDFTPDVSGDSPITFMWTFGDGMTDTAEMPSHDYGASGTYTVTLEVENCAGAGMDTYEFAVTVSCEPPMWSVYLPLVFKDYGP